MSRPQGTMLSPNLSFTAWQAVRTSSQVEGGADTPASFSRSMLQNRERQEARMGRAHTVPSMALDSQKLGMILALTSSEV